MEDVILFRASGSGALMTNKQGGGISDTQLAKIKQLEYERDFGVNEAGNKVKWHGTKKPDELAELIARRDAPPELSETAKAFVRKIWLQREKGIYKEIKSKYLEKGLFREEDAITLLTEVDGVFYTKNEERRNNKNHTGECDIYKEFPDKKIVIDTKCSWDAETFMNSEPSTDNEWQGHVYMELWDADEFHLKFCLVDCPEHLVTKEKEFAWRTYYHDSMNEEEQSELEARLAPVYDQIERNLVYSTNPTFTKEERVKTFVFHRDKSKMDEMSKRVAMAREYYTTITLNGNK